MDRQRGDINSSSSSALEELGLSQEDLDGLQNPDAKGYSGQVYFVESAGRQMVVKKFDRGEGEAENIALDILNNRDNLRKSVSPKLLYYDNDKRLIITEKVEGERLDKMENPDLAGLADSLSDVHETRYSFFGGTLAEEKDGTQYDYLQKKFDYFELSFKELSESIAQRGVEFAQGLSSTMEYLKALAKNNESYFQSRDFSLVHNDLSFDNVISTDHGVVILDWANSSIGDRALDIAKMFAKNKLDVEQQEEFLAEYETYLEDDTLRQRLAVYYPMARLNSIFTRLRQINEGFVDADKGERKLQKDYKYLISLIKE